jgi:hypothetical protein
MGYPIRTDAPQRQVGNDLVAISALLWTNPVGSWYEIHIVKNVIGDGWDEILNIVTYASGLGMYGDVQLHGTFANYAKYIEEKINAGFSSLKISAQFAIGTATVEVVDDASALLALDAALASGSWVGSLIPPTMQASYDSFWIGMKSWPYLKSNPVGRGLLTKIGDDLAQHTNQEGHAEYLTPYSDMNALAKDDKFIAALYYAAYGFTPQ